MIFRLCLDAIMFSLSRMVGREEFPIAAFSGFQASLSSNSNAFLWLRSTSADCNSALSSDIVSSYNCLKDGVILPISYQLPLNGTLVNLVHYL